MRASASTGGFTRVEALTTVIGVSLVLLLALGSVLSLGPRRHGKSDRIRCVNNLKQVGIAFRVGEGEAPSNGGFLGQVTNASEYYAGLMSLSNHFITPRILVCPTERRQRTEARDWEEFGRETIRNRAISYFAVKGAEETRPQIPLFGDRSLEARPPLPPFGYRSPRAVMGLLGTDTATIRSSLSLTPDVMHRGSANVAMADGSVQQVTAVRIPELLSATGSAGLPIIQPGEGPD